jgi:hypothetical protein
MMHSDASVFSNVSCRFLALWKGNCVGLNLWLSAAANLVCGIMGRILDAAQGKLIGLCIAGSVCEPLPLHSIWSKPGTSLFLTLAKMCYFCECDSLSTGVGVLMAWRVLC